MITTIVLPCAGEGTRLGLPFPKELAPIAPGRAAIDSCLDLIRNAGIPLRIVLMDNSKRELTRAYIEKQLPGIPLAMVRQQPEARNMPHAVVMLEPWLSEVNILMLPDAIYEVSGSVLKNLANLTEMTGFAMAAVRKPPEALRSLGALRVSGNTVMDYQEKPERSEPFNAAWTMLGWSMNQTGRTGMRVVIDVTQGQPSIAPVNTAQVVWIDDYRDCGTWDSYIKEINGDANERLAGYLPDPWPQGYGVAAPRIF